MSRQSSCTSAISYSGVHLLHSIVAKRKTSDMTDNMTTEMLFKLSRSDQSFVTIETMASPNDAIAFWSSRRMSQVRRTE